MKFKEGMIYHVYNRGNKKQPIFFSDEDYDLFLIKMEKELGQNCDVLNYCLMPNHFHLTVLVNTQPNSKHKNLNNAFGTLLRSYTRVMQGRVNFVGSLFQQKTKAKELLVSVGDITTYPVICAHYIHQNPKRAGLVNRMEDWKYSSAANYLDQMDDKFCNKDKFYLATGVNEQQFLSVMRLLNN